MKILVEEWTTWNGECAHGDHKRPLALRLKLQAGGLVLGDGEGAKDELLDDGSRVVPEPLTLHGTWSGSSVDLIGESETGKYRYRGRVDEAARVIEGAWFGADGVGTFRIARLDDVRQFQVSEDLCARLRREFADVGPWSLIVRVGAEWRPGDCRILVDQSRHVVEGLEGFGLGVLFELQEVEELPRLDDLASLPIEHLSVNGFYDPDAESGYGCAIESLKGVECLRGLRNLDAELCANLTEIEDLAGLTGLTRLNLGGSTSLANLNPLQKLTRLSELILSVDSVSDLRPLARLGSLEKLKIGGIGPRVDVRPIAELRSLTKLEIEAPRRKDLNELASLKDLIWLDLSGCGELADLSFIGSLGELKILDISDCSKLSDLSGLRGATGVTGLYLRSCGKLTSLRGIAGLPELEEIELMNCERLNDLDDLGRLTKLVRVDLQGCVRLTSVAPLAESCSVEEIDASNCPRISDLSELGRIKSLRKVTIGESDAQFLDERWSIEELNISSSTGRIDLRDLGCFPALRRLDVSLSDQLETTQGAEHLKELVALDVGYCESLRDISCLAALSALEEVVASGCPQIGRIGALAALPNLKTLDLQDCPNVRDLESLVRAPSLRRLSFDRAPLRDGVMLAIATRRRDDDLADRVGAMLDTFSLSETPDVHAHRVVEAFAVLASSGPPEQFTTAAKAIRARDADAASAADGIAQRTWERFFALAIALPDPGFRDAFGSALTDLPPAQAERILTSALLALADAPASAREWALALARGALAGLPEGPARAVAPAAAVFFHAHGLPDDVDVWIERASVKGFEGWRDRVYMALLTRALGQGDVRAARRELERIRTPERKDEARARLVRWLADRDEFRDAADELERMVDEAARATAALAALESKPAMAGDESAALTLLLALDSHPDRLGAVIAHAVAQNPGSAVAASLARAFAPLQSDGLADAFDAMLGHDAVRANTKEKKLAALRMRAAAEPALAHRALAEGAVALLAREGLVDDDEAAAVRDGLLGGGA